MPLGILRKLNTEVADKILSLKESLLKLEKESDFYVDCGDWEGWNDAFSSAINQGSGKKFVLWHQGEEESAHEDEAIALGFGKAEKGSSLEETKIIGLEIYNFLLSEGFAIQWDEDPDSYLIVDFLKTELNDFDSSSQITLEIEIPDTQELRETVTKKLKQVVEPSNENEGYMTILIRLKDGESPFDGIIRSRVDWREIKQYMLYLENESSFFAMMPLWDFDEISMEIGLEDLAKSGKNILEYEKLQAVTDKLYFDSSISEATFQWLSILALGLNTKEYQENPEDLTNALSSIDDFKIEINESLKSLEEEVETWEEASKRFNIGESMKYKNSKEFMDDINYEIMISVLNGNYEFDT
tara:strand:+ start:367 stop:1434 length:1068 start_codon:yes stop_codon:yes gene_type:complete